MPQFPLHAQAVKVAVGEIGVHEQPPGSNTGPRVREYQSASWLGGTGWPWCVAFWLWCTQQAGLHYPYRGAGAYDQLDWARTHGHAVPLSGAVPGDAVVWNLGSGHLSMLEKKYAGFGAVHTIDGNTSDMVARRVRSQFLVRGCIHVPETTVAPKPADPPVFEVIGSESGHKIIYVSGARAVGRKLEQILRRHPAGVTIRRKR